MSLSILSGTIDGEQESACMFDSDTGWTIGPIFADRNSCEEFMHWCNTRVQADTHNPSADLRLLSGAQLELEFLTWLEEK